MYLPDSLAKSIKNSLASIDLLKILLIIEPLLTSLIVTYSQNSDGKTDQDPALFGA